MIVNVPYGEAFVTRIPLEKGDGSGLFAASGDWTPASGDIKVSLDGGSFTNTATLIAHFASGWWTVTLAGDELEAAEVNVHIEDVGGTSILPSGLVIQTVGHPDAFWPLPGQGDEPEVVVSASTLRSALTGIRGEAQGGTSTTIVLESGASADDDEYNDWNVIITTGAGRGQWRPIADYAGSTRTATVDWEWDDAFAPSEGTTYKLIVA